MYDYGLSILEQYGLTADTSGRTRGGLVCRMEQGSVIIKEFRGSEKKLEHQQELLEKLSEKGHRVDFFLRNKEGGLVARDRDNIPYTVQKWYDGRECDTRSDGDILRSTGKLGRIHQDMFLNMETEYQVPDLKTSYVRHIRELRKIRKFIREKHPSCEFEMIYLNKVEVYLKSAQTALEMLESSASGKLAKEAQEKGTVCHGDYSHHNVLFLKDDMAVTNFNRWSLDIQAGDLYHFMRKILEKHNWDCALGTEMLRAYHEYRKITREEWEYLKIRFTYPDKFWKLADYYYTHSKVWISAQSTEKLKNLVSQKERWENFTKECFTRYPF